jgi:hypothetical protein
MAVTGSPLIANAAARLLNVGTIVDACVKYGVNP